MFVRLRGQQYKVWWKHDTVEVFEDQTSSLENIWWCPLIPAFALWQIYALCTRPHMHRCLFLFNLLNAPWLIHTWLHFFGLSFFSRGNLCLPVFPIQRVEGQTSCSWEREQTGEAESLNTAVLYSPMTDTVLSSSQVYMYSPIFLSL